MKISTLLVKRPPVDERGTADAGVSDDRLSGLDAAADEAVTRDDRTGAEPDVRDTDADAAIAPTSGSSMTRLLAFVVLPLVAVLLAGTCGYLKWQVGTGRETLNARIESTQAAKDSTVALLSYSPDNVEQQLGAARNLLIGTFRDSYTALTHDVVIPSAKQKQISAAATVAAVASVSATPRHAVAMVFVDQTTIVGSGAPTGTSSVVRVSLDKVDGKWLISSFDPV